MTNDPVDEIKNKLSLVSLIGEYLILKKAGRNFKALCPFHNEKTPSFIVNPDLEIYKCFGCGESGDIFSFVMKKEHLTFKEALEKLAQKTGITLATFKSSPRQLDRKAKAYKLNQSIAALYQKILFSPEGQKALNYLLKRGLTLDTIKLFQIGFVSNKWDTVTKFLNADREKTQIASEVGLLIEKNKRYYDRFRGRIMFPILNTQKAIIGFSGRIFDPLFSLADLKNMGKYINSPQSFIFDKSKILYAIDLAKPAILKEQYAVLVEGNVDAIKLHQFGITATVAPLGTALTSSQLKLLQNWTDTVYLAFDGDNAGRTATLKAVELCGQLDITSWVIPLPDKYDIDLWLQQQKTWQDLFKNKKEGPWFYIEIIAQKTDWQKASGKKTIAEKVIEFLKNFPNQVLVEYFLRLTAHRFDISEEILKQEFVKFKKKSPKNNQNIVILENKPTLKQNYLEKLFVKLLCENISLLEEISTKIELDCFMHQPSKSILQCFLKNQTKKQKLLINLLDELDQKSRLYLEELLMDEQNLVTQNIKHPLKELLALFKQIKYQNLQQKFLLLQKQLSETSDPQKTSLIMQNMLQLKKNFENT